MISLVTYEASHGSSFFTIIIISTMTFISSTTVVSIISISILQLLFLVDCWSLIYRVLIWITLHVENIVLCIICVFFIDSTAMEYYILKIQRGVPYVMRSNFLTYFAVILSLYYSHFLCFIFIMLTCVLHVPLYHEYGTP